MDRQDARDARGLEEPAGEVDAASRPLCPSISLTLASLAPWGSSRYFGPCVAQPRTIDTFAVSVPVAVLQAAPWRMICVGCMALS